MPGGMAEVADQLAGDPGDPDLIDTGEPPAAFVGARFAVCTVTGLEVALPSQFPVVTLTAENGQRRSLAIPIGLTEGVALAQAMQGVPTPRPLTHELFAQALRAAGADLIAVRIVGRTAGTYLAELDLMGSRGRECLSCRPSDGVILALRQPVAAPILVDERLFVQVGDVPPIEA